jgi:hypothetical protein
MLYREIIAVCSEIHTEHINTSTYVWAESRKLECYTGGTYNNHWASKWLNLGYTNQSVNAV